MQLLYCENSYHMPLMQDTGTLLADEDQFLSDHGD